MPISFDLEKVRKENNCTYYFETGLYDPRCDISCKQALSSGFDKVFSVEIRKDFIELGKKIFKSDIDSGKLSLYLDDSTKIQKYIKSDDFKLNKTMFFLDAHVDNQNIDKYQKKCPLFMELDAISKLERKDHIILVDDLRILKKPFPWREKSYGNINFLEEIKSKILSINKDYKFDTLNGHIEDDVLIAYL